MAGWHPFVHHSSAGCSSFKTFPNSEGEKFYPTFSSNKNHQPTIRTAEGVCRPFWYAESSYGLCLFIASLIVEGWREESLPVKSRLSQWAMWVCVVCVCGGLRKNKQTCGGSGILCVGALSGSAGFSVWDSMCGMCKKLSQSANWVCKLEEWVNLWPDFGKFSRPHSQNPLTLQILPCVVFSGVTKLTKTTFLTHFSHV